jgi:hypothetical protein
MILERESHFPLLAFLGRDLFGCPPELGVFNYTIINDTSQQFLHRSMAELLDDFTYRLGGDFSWLEQSEKHVPATL